MFGGNHRLSPSTSKNDLYRPPDRRNKASKAVPKSFPKSFIRQQISSSSYFRTLFVAAFPDATNVISYD
jgi:hypothetical protein